MAEDDTEFLRQELSIALDNEDYAELSRTLSGLTPAETASLLDSLPSAQREAIWPLIEPTDLG